MSFRGEIVLAWMISVFPTDSSVVPIIVSNSGCKFEEISHKINPSKSENEICFTQLASKSRTCVRKILILQNSKIVQPDYLVQMSMLWLTDIFFGQGRPWLNGQCICHLKMQWKFRIPDQPASLVVDGGFRWLGSLPYLIWWDLI